MERLLFWKIQCPANIYSLSKFNEIEKVRPNQHTLSEGGNDVTDL